MWYLTSGVFNFENTKIIINVPRWYEIPIQSHMLIFIAKPSTYAACCLIEFCQIGVTLSEIHFILPWSRSHTHFHHMLCFYTRSKQNSIHPQNKTPCPCMTPLSQKYIKDMGLCKNKIKDAYPKKVCHMLRHVKKRERIKYAYPKKVCHMLRHVKKKRKRKDSP